MSTSAATSRRLAAAALVLALLGGAAVAPHCAAQAEPAAKDDQPKPNPKVPENVEPLPSTEVTALLGKKVKGPTGEDLGLVVDVLVDADGQPRAAVIDFGGFLGVGSRKIAIAWKALDFGPLGRAGTVGLGLDRAQIAAAPEYKPGPPGAAAVTAPPAPPPVDEHK
jgi:hypothetical protein